MKISNPHGLLIKTGAAAIAIACFSAQNVSATGLITDTGTLTIAPTGVFDIKDNNMIVRAGNGAETREQTLARLTGYIATGFNSLGGYWDGPGINSSNAAAGDPGALFISSIGIVDNMNTGYDNSFPWPPLSPANLSGLYTEFLIKFTWTGDTNLDGVIDGADFSNFDNGFAFNLFNWFDGDTNFDGAVDGADLSALDNAFAFQTGPLVAQGGVSAVPEPASALLLCFGAVGLCARRSRK